MKGLHVLRERGKAAAPGWNLVPIAAADEVLTYTLTPICFIHALSILFDIFLSQMQR